MPKPTSAAPLLADVLWPKGEALQAAARATLLVLAGSLLLALAAKMKVPFYPVPMTMQSLAVMALGVAMGWRLASLSVLVYLAEGAFGLPVFSGTPERGIGIAYMMGPTGGFLLGFVACAAIAGFTAERRWGFVRSFLGMIAATAALYALGLAWLALFVPADKLIALGVAPFLLGDVVKAAIATLFCVLAANWAGRADRAG